MRHSAATKVLRSTVALGALAFAANAHAACNTVNGVVTCTDASTTNDANNAIVRTPQPFVTVVVAPGATVNGPFNSQVIVDSFFRTAIGYTNDGVVGTPDRPTDFVTFGRIDRTTNSFTLINRGTQNGGISALGMGGAMTGINSGLVTRGITLSGVGPIAFTNTGTVFQSNSPGASAVILLESLRTVVTTAADGTQRFADTGGLVTATIAGRVGRPATNGIPGTAEGVSVRGVGGADVTVTGQMGVLSVNAGGYTTDRLFSFNFTAGLPSTTGQSQQTVLADGRVTLGEPGSATGLFLSATGNATAIVNGTVAGGFNNVSVGSGGSESSSRQTSVSGTATIPSSQSSSNSFINTGQAALVDIGTTGRVVGSVSAGSNGGTATVRVAGAVGDTNSFGSVSARSVTNNGNSQFDSVNRPDGSSAYTNSSSDTMSGGAAVVTVATTGTVAGSISTDGDASSTVTNAGRVGGIFANSGRSITTSFSSNQSRTVTNAAGGVQTSDSQNGTSRVDETLGGAARVTNAATGIVDGSVQASGFGGVTLDNAGAIRGGVFLTSAGSRTSSANSGRQQQTTVFLPNRTVVTSLIQESSSTSSARATGGAVTGTYGGTVGTAQTGNFGGFSSINQNATTTSAASITGTVIGDFVGNAGAQNIDTTNSSTSRETTQLTGGSAREQSNTSGQVITQTASTSTLTVGATGLITDGGSGSGNVSLVSRGGNAGFTLDGGSVTGTVDVTAATDLDSTSSSTSSSSFTRAAQTSPFQFVPEVQQTQNSSNTNESRATRGTATATINGGSIGGDLDVTGIGTGTGTAAATILLNGAVTGYVSASAGGRDMRSTFSDTSTRTGPMTVDRTMVSSSSSAPATHTGNVLITASGTVGGGIFAIGGAGSATVNLSGRAGTVTPDGVTVLSFDFASQNTSAQSSTSQFFFNNFPLTASRTTNASTTVGGTATLNVTPAVGPATNASSIEGDVFVQGRTGSTLNLAAGTRIVQTAGRVVVGAAFSNTTSETNGVFANGAQTGSTGASTTVIVGGPASLTNAGIVGSTANQANVLVGSVGGATARNTGTINGSLRAVAANINRTTSTVTTGLNVVRGRRTVTTATSTPVLGAALIDNSGLVTADISMLAGTGVVTNSGVVRGAVTLGGGLANFTTTTTTTINPTTGATVTTNAPSIPNAVLATQDYRLEQSGLLVGGVNVTGATTTDPSGATVRTSNVNATVNLNNGSITLGTIAATASTNANVNLNGNGFLGVAANDLSTNLAPGQIVTGFAPTPSLARFSAIDPALGNTVPLPSGSRISGVQTVIKAGDGIFVIVGAPVVAATGTTAAVNTLDVGALRVTGGELQLGLAGATATANTFGIRGNVDNAASLVVGRRITDGTQTAVRGVNVAVGGNLTNAATGSLVVGVNPSFVRPNAAAPFVPFGQTPSIASTNSFVSIDGNLALAGTVAVQTPTGGIYEAGRAYDLFSVGGVYSNTGAVRTNLASPFVTFTLTPRSEGGRTIVSLDVARANYDTVATDRNSAAAARALQASIAGVTAGIRNGSPGSQDLASIIASLDTQFTAAQSAEAFRQLSSGEFYGSLAAISTTAPFGEATDGLPGGDGPSGVGLWFRPTGQFATYNENEQAGASAIDLSNYGGSIGVDYATGTGGHVGVAGGYGALVTHAVGTPERAEAKTYMVGGYASQQLDRLHVSAQAVYGWSDWDATRGLPLFGRTATSSFKSTEVRASLRVAYAIAIDNLLDLTPFARGEARRFRFDGFTEAGAGSIGLAVGRRSKTVFNPELGLRLAGSTDATNRIRPFAEGSYVFQGDPGTDRRVGFLGNTAAAFDLAGVLPGDAIKAAVGVDADIGVSSVFIRADYASGGRQQVGSVRGGVLLRF